VPYFSDSSHLQKKKHIAYNVIATKKYTIAFEVSLLVLCILTGLQLSVSMMTLFGMYAGYLIFFNV